ALTTTDWHQGVERLETGLQWLMHALAIDDARRLELHLSGLLGLDGTEPVDGLPERVDDTTQQGLAHRDLGDAARPLDRVALANRRRVTQQGDTDVVFLEVEDDAEDVVRELEHLARHGVLEPVNTSNTVT